MNAEIFELCMFPLARSTRTFLPCNTWMEHHYNNRVIPVVLQAQMIQTFQSWTNAACAVASSVFKNDVCIIASLSVRVVDFAFYVADLFARVWVKSHVRDEMYHAPGNGLIESPTLWKFFCCCSHFLLSCKLGLLHGVKANEPRTGCPQTPWICV